MKTEEIVKQLNTIRELVDFGRYSPAIHNIRILVEKLETKTKFVLGPAKYADGTDCNILAIHTDEEQGIFTEYIDGGKWWSRWHRLDGVYIGGSNKNVLPNNEPEEKVYGPQKCNEPVKLCMNCDCETVKCFACHNYSEWEPIPTDKELWDRVLAFEKVHKDAADSKLNFGDKE